MAQRGGILPNGATYGRVRIDQSGAVEIDGAPVVSMGWVMRGDPNQVVTLTVTVPVIELSGPEDAEVRLLYVSDLRGPMDGPEVVADTPAAALRALADALDARESGG